MSRALQGVRILDLADRSGAMTGRIMADLGAEVILVEPPGGNSIRAAAPFLDDEPGPDQSFAHQYYNANKQSVVLDLDDPADRDRFLALAATADAIIDTERPGRLADLGLDHDRLQAVSPGLVQVSITPYGQNGEWRDRTATDLTAGASGGLIWVSGEPRSVPVQGGANPSYTMAGLTGASAAMTALTARWHQESNADSTDSTDNSDGADSWPGVHIDISLQEATVMTLVQTSAAGQLVWHDRVPRRPGLSAALACADGGYVGLLVRPDRFDEFLAWCDRVGIDHSMTSEDWEWSLLSAPRKDNPVAEATLALARALTRDEFAEGALEADLVCLPVLGFDDLEHHEQFVVNEQFLTVEHQPLKTELGFVRSPVDAMADGVTIERAPQLGEHQALLDSVSTNAAPTDAVSATAPATAPSAAPPSVSVADPARALEGIRVVDFGWVLAAPIGTRILASFGAEVLRVESDKKPDSMRSQIGPHGKPDADLGGLFNTVNAGKKSLSIDLSTENGMAVIKDLIATADVVVNNFRPGAMDRMGLGYDVLRALKPDIVLLNLPGAHRKGPWAVRASMGNILMAASGFNMLTGFDGERPRGIGIPYPDFTSPHLLVSTVLAALRHRSNTGEGQELHLAQLSGTVSLLGAEWMEYVATGKQPARKANRDPNYCPHGVYPAQGSEYSDDEWVTLVVADDKQWRSLCELMGRPELVDDKRFADHQSRKANEDAIDAEIKTWTADQDKWDVAERCQGAGIAAAPVEHLADTYSRDPQLRHHYQIVHQPIDPSIDIPIDREAAQWIGADHRLVRSPMMGEHNEYVIREILGRSEEEYINLIVDETLG